MKELRIDRLRIRVRAPLGRDAARALGLRVAELLPSRISGATHGVDRVDVAPIQIAADTSAGAIADRVVTAIATALEEEPR
jgi:hypothetical protein